MGEPAKFVSFASFIDTAFWSEVNKRKLNEWKLDESPKLITASIGVGDSVGTDCRLSFGHESFDSEDGIQGELVVFNTVEAFKKLSKADFLKTQGLKIWNSILDGSWLFNPRVLYHFAFTTFADLKKFQYFYWLCTPAAFNSPLDLKFTKSDLIRIERDFSGSPGLEKERIQIFVSNKELFPLSALKDINSSSIIQILIDDPSPVPGVPGWPIRNLITAIAHLKPTWNSIEIFSNRGGNSGYLFHFTWTPIQSEIEPQFTGWEPNAQGKLLPRFVDLKNQFDPKRLMEQSVALNLSLIKWRIVPDLKLDRFEALKVLIFGAGTLGCNLARNLLAYNVRVISFVDNSHVSYSNPVRQSLSKFDDAKQGRGKAETAAEALKEIYPSVDARAYHLTVPMPGHSVAPNEEEQLKQTVEKLEELIANHDVVFLALDSREARWLPTVIGTKHAKMVFSVALGFDQFVVIRHGLNIPGKEVMEMGEDSHYIIPNSQLACYFCSDVTAPGNSTNDRTLDQQCTVSRPGLSPIASGVAVELLASLLQSPDPQAAPASIGEQDENSSLFGTTPHQVRGYLFRFQQMTPAVRRFEKCVACGPSVATKYQEDNWIFVKDVLNSPSYLEQVSGVDELQQSAVNVDIDFTDDSDSVMSL